MGVCAHELGHLAFQWEDFYDPDGGGDGVQWAGTGRRDLMAGGSWDGDKGDRPAHPIGLHKSQHGWVTVTEIDATTLGVTLPPFSASGGTVARVAGPAYAAGQFLLLENRQRVGFIDPVTRVATLDVTVQAGPSPSLATAGGAGVGVPVSGVTPAPPFSAAAILRRLLAQRTVSADELAPLVLATAPTTLDVERAAMALPPVPGEGDPPPKKKKPKAEAAGRGQKAQAVAPGPPDDDPTTFGNWVWRRYRANVRPGWTRLGSFGGAYTLTPRGPNDYLYAPGATPFSFTRANGEVVTPGRMTTDGGSVPRVAWLLPNLDPWTYLHAYALHDWLFITHHCQRPGDPANTFGRANTVLAEAIYTLMRAEPDEYAPDWRNVVAVSGGVSSPVGRGVWDRQWDAPGCGNALPRE